MPIIKIKMSQKAVREGEVGGRSGQGSPEELLHLREQTLRVAWTRVEAVLGRGGRVREIFKL